MKEGLGQRERGWSEFSEEVTCHLGLERRERTNHMKGSVGTKVRTGLGSLRNIKERVLLESRDPGGSGVRAGRNGILGQARQGSVGRGEELWGLVVNVRERY